MKNIPIGLFLMCAVIGCKRLTPPEPVEYKVGTFPTSPINMTSFNSIYDDYNMALPPYYYSIPFCYSTNRNSEGANFDIIFKILEVDINADNGGISVKENLDSLTDQNIANQSIFNALKTINTNADELGPLLIPQSTGKITTGRWKNMNQQNYLLLYANNQAGNLDIKFTQNESSNNYAAPLDISFLNSDKDDAYPTLMADTSFIYFCSNRGNDFDLYKASINHTNNFIKTFSDNVPRQITKDTILCSIGDDKCPTISGKLMVFTSNRPGGFGGFDLYYSIFKNGTWGAPINFGDKINTAYDEYRPIVKNFGTQFTNDFLAFSSNRPGGMGGFDLYYVGIPKMIE